MDQNLLDWLSFKLVSLVKFKLQFYKTLNENFREYYN